jgi:hypothetical protein
MLVQIFDSVFPPEIVYTAMDTTATFSCWSGAVAVVGVVIDSLLASSF